MSSRLERCRAEMAIRGIGALLVQDLENVRYLSGFTGSAGRCLITPDGGWFVTDGRYILQASDQVKDLEVIIDPTQAYVALNPIMARLGSPIGFEVEHLSVAQFDRLREACSAEFTAVSGLVEKLRSIKDPAEIELIRAAVQIVDETFTHILNYLTAGLTEREIAIEIDFQMRRLGADKEGFDSIVATGPHSAWPHARPTDRRVAAGDFIKLDFGALRQCYNSDITRTVVMGEPDDEQRRIYAVVLDAQMTALSAIRPGQTGREIDAVARGVIETAGYGDQFTHNLGHALGRKVHDGPGFGRQVEQTLEPGMVLTVEPGIYVEGLGGVRIEDDVLITDTGCEILTRSRKELICV
jgi:Xaa-Pro aminopeptidase